MKIGTFTAMTSEGFVEYALHSQRGGAFFHAAQIGKVGQPVEESDTLGTLIDLLSQRPGTTAVSVFFEVPKREEAKPYTPSDDPKYPRLDTYYSDFKEAK